MLHCLSTGLDLLYIMWKSLLAILRRGWGQNLAGCSSPQFIHMWEGARQVSITCSFVVQGEAWTFKPLRMGCGCGQATNCILQQCLAGHLLFAPSLLYNISALFCTMPFFPTIVASVGTQSYAKNFAHKFGSRSPQCFSFFAAALSRNS